MPSFHLLALAAAVAGVASAQNTPVMGWNSYNAYSCSPNATGIVANLNALSSQGFVGAGYKTFMIDCGWVARNQPRVTGTNYLPIDTAAFPNGLKPISDQALAKGMQWGMYSDAGFLACDTTVPSDRLGSLNNETADAALFASLNTTYVKYDNCYAGGTTAGDNAPKDPRTDFPSRYARMWNALKNVNINKMLICQWGTPYAASNGLQGPADWTPAVSTSFRLSDDITGDWNAVKRILDQSIQILLRGKTGAGHFADGDLLEVGNPALSIDEQGSHFAYWAMMKSALFISTDLTQVSTAVKNILLNANLIAINQDSAAKPVTLVQRFTGDHDVHAGPLANGDKAVLAVNWKTSSNTITIPFSLLNVSSATVRNLWTNATTTGATSYTATVNAHGSVPLRLSNIKYSTPAGKVTYYEAESGTVSGDAAVASCSGCSGGKKVGYIDANGSLTLNNIAASATTSTLLFDYLNCQVGYIGGINSRVATVSVNGGAAQTVEFPLSGYNWDTDVLPRYRVTLPGFKVGSANSITITGTSSGYGPDLDRVGIIA